MRSGDKKLVFAHFEHPKKSFKYDSGTSKYQNMLKTFHNGPSSSTVSNKSRHYLRFLSLFRSKGDFRQKNPFKKWVYLCLMEQKSLWIKRHWLKQPYWSRWRKVLAEKLVWKLWWFWCHKVRKPRRIQMNRKHWKQFRSWRTNCRIWSPNKWEEYSYIWMNMFIGRLLTPE